MTEELNISEVKPISKKEEKVLSTLEQVNLVKDEVSKLNEETKEHIAKLQELKADELLSGKAPVAKPEEKKEMTPSEYKDEVMAGRIPEK